MRALLFHCKKYKTKINKLSNRPKGIKPEEIKEKEQKRKDCIVSLITIEKEDILKKADFEIAKEISKMSKEVGHNNIIILPFAHLSNNLASTKECIEVINSIENKLKKKFNITREHFGSHKSLLIDIYGHVGNVRYREF